MLMTEIDEKKTGEDPVRSLFAGRTPDLKELLELFPRTKGEPAFDPELIQKNIEKLKTAPEVNTGHPLLDRAVKTGLVFIDLTFQGCHPKYGGGGYAHSRHDGFPPTIVAAVDALSAWGLNRRAKQLFAYWVSNFIRSDGTIDYYGPSISEYGQLLHTAALLAERAGTEGWWGACLEALAAVSLYLENLHAGAEKEGGLIAGSPEADEREKRGRYFHNNLWASRGLADWARLCRRTDFGSTAYRKRMALLAESIHRDCLEAIRDTWPESRRDWWLPPQTEQLQRPGHLTATREASYTNYRYWPEMLSSGGLPKEMAERIVEARLHAGGQFCGMTRFADWLDDWPLADYLFGLWALGRREDFLLSLYGHIGYHHAETHLTAYEQVTLPPGKPKAPYCLPCQLVAARTARLLVS
jgi:hypothetical protein